MCCRGFGPCRPCWRNATTPLRALPGDARRASCRPGSGGSGRHGDRETDRSAHLQIGAPRRRADRRRRGRPTGCACPLSRETLMKRLTLIALVVVVVAAVGVLAWRWRTPPEPAPVAGVAQDLAR